MDLKKCFKYRNVWMGIAMLWIVIFHSELYVGEGVLYNIKRLGYGGVDIFLFASGIGCYFSLEKNNDYLNFIKRRIVRLIPTYWCFLLVWCSYQRVMNDMSVKTILGNFLCVQRFTGEGGEFNWYISALWGLYLLAPLFKNLVDHTNCRKQFVKLIMFLIILTIPFWKIDSWIIMVTRIPVFVVGMYFAKVSEEQSIINKKNMIYILSNLILGILLLIIAFTKSEAYLWSHGLFWYPFIFITPSICFLISYVVHKFIEMKWMQKISGLLSKIGEYSFEIFLVHIFINDIYLNLLVANGIVENRNRYWILIIFAIIPACVILIYMRKFIENCWNKLIGVDYGL